MKTRNLIKNFISSLRIKACRRLIQNQHLGIHSQYTCNSNSSFLPSGKLERRFCIITFIKTHMSQCLFGPFFAFFLSKILILRSKTHICQYIGLKKLMLRILKYQTHLASKTTKWELFCPDVLTLKINFPLCRTYQTIKMLNQCRFTAACMPDNSHKLSLRDFQINIFQSMHLIRCTRVVCVIHMFQPKRCFTTC